MRNSTINTSSLNINVICEQCGIAFSTTSDSQKYCSASCKAAARWSRRKVTLRDLSDELWECPRCHKMFVPSHWQQKYCSRECKEIAKRERYGNARDNRRIGKTRICSMCGEEFACHYGGGTVYCSDECRRMAKSERIARDGRKKRERERRELPQIEVICPICGNEFETHVTNKKYCSADCRRKARLERSGRCAKNSRGRWTIFERDNFTCAYCGRTSFGDGVRLHLDHVVPTMGGGENIAGNVITSCIDCNVQKSDRSVHVVDKLCEEIEKRNLERGIDSKMRIDNS